MKKRSLLRGETGLRSECAQAQQETQVPELGPRKRFHAGRPGNVETPRFYFSFNVHESIVSAEFLTYYSSPEALAAAPCSRAGQMDS